MRLFEMVRTLSQLKDKEGRFLLGYVYRHLAECEGIKPAENFKKAFKCFSDDILKDFQPALLGKALTYLNIPNSNEELYIKYLSEAAKAEDTDCLKKIRNLIRSLNLKIDDPDDRALFKDCVKFVRTSKAKSLFLAGGISLLPHDSENEEITYSGIFDWFVEAADIGDEMSEMLLGYYHAAGFYLEPNKKMALKYLGRALRKGNTQASAIIAVILENDEFPPRDLKKFDEYLTNQDDRHFTLLRKTVENRNKKSKKKRADEDLPPQSPRRRGLYCSDAVERSARFGKRNDAEELFSNPDFCLKAADLGLGEAQLQVGLTRLESAVSESEKRKAFDIIEKAQKNGAAESDAHLGWLLINGVGTKRDFKKGHGLLERGCSSGSPLALYRMGRALFEGLGVPKDLLAAENYFFEAADNDNAEAALKLAEMYHNGLGSKTDRFKSLACLYKAAILGNADAQYRYGRAIMPKSRLSGLVCDVGAARGDFAYDVFNSSVNGLFENTPPAAKPPRRNGNSRNGRSVSKESHSRNLRTILNMEEVDLLASVEIAHEFSDAILFLQSAAEKNHPLALLRLGECLLTGTDIERDVESAIAYFEAAADEGAIEAHSYLGLASLFGVGRPSDVPKAIKHFKVAGQHGSAFAQTMLGEIYANPRHGINEVKEGLRWYRRAAAKNNPYTWYLLAELCHRGENLEPDLFKALKFHEKADAAGDAASRFQIYVLLSENPLNPSPEIVEKHLLESAKRGSTDALFVLAKLFQTGRVFEQNVKLAVDSHKLASDGGHDGSMVELGKMSLAGTAGTAGIDGSDAALEYFLEAERLGNPEATYLIGKMSAEGLAGLPRDPRRAFERYRKAAALGQRDALFEIGKFRAGEELSPEEFRLKVDCLEKAARFGQPGAVTIMGDLVREGRLGAPDPGKALRLYEYAASLEEPEALYRLGLLSLEAKEDKDRLKKAFDFFLRASAKNHAPSQFCLHVFLDEGLLGKKDEAGAMKYLELAAENGSGDAQRELGLRFLRGVSVEKDVSEALKWLGKAEENGDGRASRVIADTLFKGEGVKADPAKAVKHYESAADKGDGGAQYALAMICLKGSAGFRDPDKAFRLFNLAKDRGYPRSFYYLGVMAEKGEGTPKD
ncbi:MAG: sel1 repeat family protein, partial [Deltaproteobacteria bacterium]|nr:sel1 repeat family protein [Deltaproteobacteria bacterium]